MSTYEVNKPNGKSEQHFYCFKPWEGKHITGKNQKKLNEFRALPGIRNITFSEARARLYGSWTDQRAQDFYAKYTIQGSPAAVDDVMRRMTAWLQECQAMYFDKF